MTCEQIDGLTITNGSLKKLLSSFQIGFKCKFFKIVDIKWPLAVLILIWGLHVMHCNWIWREEVCSNFTHIVS
jgi:hypothetical protein